VSFSLKHYDYGCIRKKKRFREDRLAVVLAMVIIIAKACTFGLFLLDRLLLSSQILPLSAAFFALCDPQTLYWKEEDSVNQSLVPSPRLPTAIFNFLSLFSWMDSWIVLQG